MFKFKFVRFRVSISIVKEVFIENEFFKSK